MPLRQEYESEVVRLADLAIATHHLGELTFTNCLLLGPAVLVISGCTLESCIFEADPVAFFWPIDAAERPVIIGAILMENCVFEDCRFQGIGFAGPPAMLQEFPQHMTPEGPVS